MAANIGASSPDSFYINVLSQNFDVTGLKSEVDTALKDLVANPSDPSVLAKYQSKLSEYNLYRNAQSNVVKTFKDIDAAIIQNFR
ncbi:type III secretion system needle complex protein [Chromobacterium vaccinii]|uniref:Type III secretion system needle complex protein n=1 Tax=Chromobacterium piscinae TaxID=686831 RepID=A0ABV0H810_9NEIS|nr:MULTISPECIES: type III secretion system needle complex protein [Chromobacterium]MCD4484626.1 type III secretion system needle complex protein [Chromobacterium vaccinii]MCD4505098.1 type III secretion system needle complex protein [Chromobacterium piscinae]MCD5326514.1 type III secretion system needle complex protein [Chromobacterium piscinae]